MPIYLLLKQHNKTKMQYLCKRTTNDVTSCFRYTGSGKRWKNHINKHGKDISTCILEICKTNEELKQKAKPYNQIWQVDTNNKFCNLRPEEGDGGNTWYDNIYDRKKKLSNALKKFNNTQKGKQIRKQCGRYTSIRQKGKTMKQRLGNLQYIDSRTGKSREQIYTNPTHPQSKPFYIKHIQSNTQWEFKCESDLMKILSIHPYPILGKLKQTGEFVFKQKRKNSKHLFKKGDKLIFKYKTT